MEDWGCLGRPFFVEWFFDLEGIVYGVDTEEGFGLAHYCAC